MLIQNNVKAKLYEYKYLEHGMLTFSLKDFEPAKLFYQKVRNDIWYCFNNLDSKHWN